MIFSFVPAQMQYLCPVLTEEIKEEKKNGLDRVMRHTVGWLEVKVFWVPL